MQGIYAVLLAAEGKIGVPGCWDDVMEHQMEMGMFGLHDLAFHPDLVEAAVQNSSLKTMQIEGEYMVSPFLKLYIILLPSSLSSTRWLGAQIGFATLPSA